MGKLRDKMSRDLIIRGYSKKTQLAYLTAVQSLAKYFIIPPDQLTAEQVNQFQLYLIQDKKLSYSHYNLISCALRFFYKVTVGQSDAMVAKIPKYKTPKKVPVTLALEEITQILNLTKNLKYKTVLMVMVASGLRISEVLNLKATDIDSKLMIIRIRSGKRNKDRSAILSPALLDALRKYWAQYPGCKKHWLFPSKNNETCHLLSGCINQTLKKVAKHAGINKKISTHSLRHSFSTLLLESGVGIKQLQILLGHADLKSTMIYSQQAQIQNLKIITPLDLIYKKLV